MELVVLAAILALLIFAPRGGKMPGPVAIVIGLVVLLWLAVAFGLGSLWNAIVGPVAQP